MKILIVEDEKDIADPLKRSLGKQSFAVDVAYDGKAALEFIRKNGYDCILLDLNLPEVDGIKVSQIIRQEKNTTPVIMLTARSQIYDKLKGFDAGADDYVTKPFDLSELIARINTVIKRNSLNKLNSLKFDKFELFPDKNMIVRSIKGKSSEEIELSNKETGVLEYLLRNKGKIISTEELLEHVWDSEIDLFTDTLKTHIKTLRKKIDPDKKIITTIRGKGYCIN
ncbi:MAG: response regulator transcription factor [Candidatus Dojkabacteria bacterium]|nr:response regulator transcription factor [Candidatus Dojkabacteria bacterium]